MAKISVKFVCGCGFTTPSMVAAVAHSDQTGHTLDAAGMIVGEKKKKEEDK